MAEWRKTDACLKELPAHALCRGMPGTAVATRLQCGRPDHWVVFCSGHSMQDARRACGPRAQSLMTPFEAGELRIPTAEIRVSADNS